jgi:ABC-2 type transport system permease protein
MKNTFAWSVRREVWEHRSVWLAPIAVAAFLLFALLFGMSHFTGNYSGSFSTLPLERQRLIVAMPFGITASVILLTAFVVAIFYCLDALYAERRDRSILFWKSMPVSDMTTVLAKAFIPLAVIPAIAFVIALAMQAVLLVFASVALQVRGIDTALMYDHLPMAAMTIGMLYGIAVHVAWYAPVYALLLMVSAATRRPFLWVVVPVLAVQLLEKIAFNTNYSGAFIRYRLMGAMEEAFKPNAMKWPITALSQLDPIRYLSTPGLWLGLLAAAAFLYAAIRLRRSMEPMS